MAIDGLNWALWPNDAFGDQWKGWIDFLGNGKSIAKSPEEWVPVAEALAEEHGGVLPCGLWLRENGFSGLASSIRNRPELFEHIRQDNKRGRTPEEWVAVAIALATEHGGTLPYGAWLRKNGYSGLYDVMRRRPGLFEHIPQVKKVNYPHEYVKIAEDLANSHGGVMPCTQWLMKNGFRAMEAVIRRNPGLFEHIPKECRRKRIEEHVKEAERIAAANGGLLPGTGWRRRNGHKDLDSQIRVHPDAFAHIKVMARGHGPKRADVAVEAFTPTL